MDLLGWFIDHWEMLIKIFFGGLGVALLRWLFNIRQGKNLYLWFKPQFKLKLKSNEIEKVFKKGGGIEIPAGIKAKLKILSVMVINNRGKNARNVTLKWEINYMSNNDKNYPTEGILPKMEIPHSNYLSLPLEFKPGESGLFHLCHHTEQMESRKLHFICKGKPNGGVEEDYHIPLNEIKSLYIYVMCDDSPSRKMKLSKKFIIKYLGIKT